MKNKNTHNEYPTDMEVHHLIRVAVATEPMMALAILLQFNAMLPNKMLFGLRHRDLDMKARCIKFPKGRKLGNVPTASVPMIPAVYELLKPLKIGKTSELLFPDRTFLRRLKAISLKAGDQMLSLSWRSRDREYADSIECQILAIFTMALFLDREKEDDKLAGN